MIKARRIVVNIHILNLSPAYTLFDSHSIKASNSQTITFVADRNYIFNYDIA